MTVKGLKILSGKILYGAFVDNLSLPDLEVLTQPLSVTRCGIGTLYLPSLKEYADNAIRDSSIENLYLPEDFSFEKLLSEQSLLDANNSVKNVEAIHINNKSEPWVYAI